jgi:hypothetical protein
MNKTSICSVVALDIIDYSKKTDAEQQEIKKLFDGFICQAVIDIPQEDRLIVDTAHGAVIVCNGPLEDALEDALFISITIRDEILKNNMQGTTPLYVQFGIHLGAARVVKNNIVGEGADEAQRIMSFANPNQILVSNVYFEMASKLTQEIAQMFEKYEMHAHEHDVYAVRLLKEAPVEEPLIPADHAVPAKWQSVATQVNWTYIALSVLVLAAFFALAKAVITPVEPIITVEQPVVAEPPAATEVTIEQPVVAEPLAATEVTVKPSPAGTKQKELKAATVAQKKPKQDAPVKVENVTSQPEKPAEKTTAKSAESNAERSDSKVESTWETIKGSVKQGEKRECTQAEIAMNQCAK